MLLALAYGLIEEGRCSAFIVIQNLSAPPIPPVVPLLGLLACVDTAGVLIAYWSAALTRGADHYLALATGCVLTYAWSGLSGFVRGPTELGAPVDIVDIVGQLVLILAILGLIAWGVVGSRGIGRASSPLEADVPMSVSVSRS